MHLSILSLLTLAVSVSSQVVPWDGRARIRLYPDGACLQAAGNSDGAPVSVIDCPSLNNNNTWTVESTDPDRSGTRTTRLKIFDNKCLDVPSGNNADGTKLQIWTCYDGNANQVWQLNGDFTITWGSNNKCVDLTDGVVGGRAQLWTCTSGNQNQLWVPWPASY
ncbi:ricin B lectin [Serendipita vermifera]|nr:ricin B lectin [Serendipita vermifera]